MYERERVDLAAGMGYEEDGEGEEEGEVAGGHASRWKQWLAGARVRYTACKGAVPSDLGASGKDPDCNPLEEAGEGVVPADGLGKTDAGVPRAATSSAVRFDCGKLIKAVKIEGARKGEKQWRWQPLRCQDECDNGGDVDDYSGLLGNSYDASCFAPEDPVYVIDLEASKSEPGSDGWLARSGIVQKVECADDRDARGRDGVVRDKLVLTLHACSKPAEWRGVPQVQ